MNITTIPTVELGDRSYLIDDGTWGIVVDPQRDIDRFVEAIEARGLRIGIVCETHRHNDYVTGGFALAREIGAAYVVPAGEIFDRHDEAIHDGEQITIGDLTLRAVETPGHTLGHVAYVVTRAGKSAAAFTGGSLLYGNVGRTDLVSAEQAATLALAQLRSVRRLAGELENDTALFPTHGFGSFCAAGSTSLDGDGTVGAELIGNLALSGISEAEFVESLVAGFGDYPSYYAHIGPLNRKGPSAADLREPKRIDVAVAQARADQGEWVVDLRPATEFAAAHLPQTINVPIAPALATQIGWLAPWGQRITLVSPTFEIAREAVRSLARVGIERPDACIVDPTTIAARDNYPVVEWDALATAAEPMVVLDVRNDQERATGHVAGSVHIPLHRLPDQLDELPDATIWVHCQSGFRAAIASSLIERSGRTAVLILDDLANAPGSANVDVLARVLLTEQPGDRATDPVIGEVVH